MERLRGMVEDFLEDRPVIKKGNTPQKVVELLKDEVVELSDAINGEPRENWGRELADVLFFTLTLAIQADIDLDKELAEKTARNHVKYVASNFQEGDYNEARRKSVQEWKDINGEVWFYEELPGENQ